MKLEISKNNKKLKKFFKSRDKNEINTTSIGCLININSKDATKIPKTDGQTLLREKLTEHFHC